MMKKNNKIKDTIEFDFLEIDNNDCLIIEGKLITNNIDLLPLLVFYSEKKEFQSFTECISKTNSNSIYKYKVNIKLERNSSVIMPSLSFGKNMESELNVDTGRFFPMSNIFTNMYICIKSRIIRYKNKVIYVYKKNLFRHLLSEMSFKMQLLLFYSKDKNMLIASKKALFIRSIVSINKFIRKKPVLLFKDRPYIADDNATVLFKFINKEKKYKNSYFAISKKSEYYNKIKKIGRVVDCFSWKYKILYLSSDAIITSSADDDVFDIFQGHYEPYKSMEYQTRRIFLQHGVIHNDLSEWLDRYKKNIYGFICSSRREKNSILYGKYNYKEENLWLTGMPRYDELTDNKEKIITVMPTWREYLMGERKNDWTFNYSDLFLTSDFYKTYLQLFKDKELNDVLKQTGYTIQLKLHPAMECYKDCFNDKNINVTEDSYKDIFKKSALVITDYSSAVFDFAYLRKPILYYQFDKKEFYERHLWKEGYFAYENDGFGQVCNNLKELVNEIKEYIKAECKIEVKYRDRIDSFFEFNDKNNCSRVIEKLEKCL